MGFNGNYADSGLPAESENPTGAETGRTGINRRNFLIGSGAAVGASLIAARLGLDSMALAHEGGDHAEPSLGAWAATKHRGRYLAVAGSGEAPEIRVLTVGAAGEVSLGYSAGIALPATFTALALHSTGDRLLVAGAEPVGDSSRAAVYDVTGTAAVELPLDAGLAFSVATALASTSPRHVAVLVEGAADAEQLYNDITLVATSDDAGGSWAVDTLAKDLGEGYFGHLAAVDQRLFAITVDGAGQRQGHERAASGEWRPVSADDATGPVLAMTSRGDAVDLLAHSDGAVRRSRRSVDGTGWQDAGTVEIGQPVLAVLPVNGAPGELIAIGESSAHLVDER